ncbi:MAG: TolC family protein, partial [Proteobacteria bacterium]|nr:TolC family protein [Pseudomonadota bacterium]
MTPSIDSRYYATPFKSARASLAAIAMVSVLHAAELTDQAVLSVETAIEAAVRDNPGLAEMRSRYAAMAEIPSQAGALPDPVLSFAAMNLPMDTFNRDQEAMTQMQLGFSQLFPFPGKRGLREQAAEFEARAAFFSIDEMRLRLINQVVSKWWQVYYLDRAVDTVESNRLLLAQFIEVARTKYETGTGLQQDVLLAQLELSKLLDQEIQIESLRRN